MTIDDIENKIFDNIQTRDLNGALSLIIDTYGHRVLYLIRRIIDNTEDAEDVYQDVMVLVFRNLTSFKKESKIFTWIYRIALREAIRHAALKKKKYMHHEWADHMDNKYQSHLQHHTEEKIWQHLYKAIDTLPEKQKSVFLLRYFDELPYSEISKITTSSESTLKTNYHFAVEKIKKIIENENRY